MTAGTQGAAYIEVTVDRQALPAKGRRNCFWRISLGSTANGADGEASVRVVGAARRAGGPCTNGVTESARLVFSRAWPVEQAVTGRGMRLGCTRVNFEPWFQYPAELARRGAKPPRAAWSSAASWGGGH